MLPEEANATLQNPSGPLSKLFVDDERRLAFQEAVFSGIGHYPIIDSMSVYGTMKLAFSVERPNPAMERSLSGEFRAFLANAIPALDASDGFNAYVGMLGALYASDFKALLIDEPEAFLHPALARTLGGQIAKQSLGKQVYIATHSSEFLMGAVEAGVPVRIVRLQFQSGISTASLLNSDELRKFMFDPLLRSANVLAGLFSRSVVVSESDTDRAFYQEINTRLLAKRDARGIDNALFLNAQNKQTVPKIVGLLRRMGVPAVGIVDLDVLEEGGAIWSSQMSSIGIPSATKRSFEAMRDSALRALRSASGGGNAKDYKTQGGVELLNRSDKEAVETFLENLATYGLLVVPSGEVESWLSKLNISRSKSTWLRQIFETMGTDPSSAGYVLPARGDVWEFIGRCRSWLTDPSRRGMDVSSKS